MNQKRNQMGITGLKIMGSHLIKSQMLNRLSQECGAKFTIYLLRSLKVFHSYQLFPYFFHNIFLIGNGSGNKFTFPRTNKAFTVISISTLYKKAEGIWFIFFPVERVECWWSLLLNPMNSVRFASITFLLKSILQPYLWDIKNPRLYY